MKRTITHKTLAVAGCVSALAFVIPLASADSTLSLQGSCTSLASKLARLDNTLIDTATRIDAGELKVGGHDIAAHCLIQGRMNPRTGIDGAHYAVGFEMRLPLAWNGRFFYQPMAGWMAV